MTISFRPPSAALLFAIALLASCADLSPARAGPQDATEQRHAFSPLVAKVRGATKQYRHIDVALSEGWVQATPCVSGPNTGAMGVHFVLPSRVRSGVLEAGQPQSLIYEPLPDGKLRLVGVEFIILAEHWAEQHPDGSTPALDGHLLNYVGAPNRYGLPAFYELHVWSWEENPVGSFADWNTQVTCDQQLPPM
jgi:hypothetical protein